MNESAKDIADIIEDRNRASVGFKLISLKLEENPILGNLFLNFCDDLNQLEDHPFNTVIIGPNGTGKSNILRTIINVFREIHEIKTNGKRINTVQGKFSISYLLDGKLFTFGNLRLKSQYMDARFPKGFWFLIDGQIEENVENILLPKSIVANSLMITDKYPFLNKEDFPNYTYLGVRSSRSSSGTRAYVRKTVELISASIGKKGFKEKLKNILEYLDLEKTVDIYYKPIYAKEFYKEDIDEKEFHRIFTNQKEYFPKRGTEIWGTKYYRSISENTALISEIVTFLRQVALTHLKGDSKLLHYNVLADRNIVHDFRMIEELKRLDIISFPSIDIRKRNSAFSLVESSSGEYSLLSSLIGLVASVEDNSFVLIDEPEVSLHPNWQMKYMDQLRDIFQGFGTCHFLIATHSHFLVSDAKGINSQIIGLKKEDTIQPIHFSNINTFGWSAEDVLYNIFDVRTTRNFYFENDLNNLIDLLNRGSDDYLQIENLITKFKEIQIDDADPLNVIIEKANKYLVDHNA